MHEYTVTENVLRIALEKAGEAEASRVTQINLVVGDLSGAVPECIQFYFDSFSKNTIAEGAVLHFDRVQAQLRCRSCSTPFQPENGIWDCPACHSQGIEVVGGRDLYIESMEIE